MDIFAKIKSIKYIPFLSGKLKIFPYPEFEQAILQTSVFVLDFDGKGQLAVSWWVSAKRTRSYPYVRVYDTLAFSGKRLTIIPIFKDEGAEGDRDFLQWDTVSLMSLLDVYVIIGYYESASRSSRYRNKITNQRFDISYLKSEIERLLSYKSSALHWNLEQVDKAAVLTQKALYSYAKISDKTGVPMHSNKGIQKRIAQLIKGKGNFKKLSRQLAKTAQLREKVTTQPKERLMGIKASLTIKNYLGGYYYFTSDEVEIESGNVYLIEGKHSKTNSLPSLEDIKDGLLKMVLFTNLEDVEINSKSYNAIPVLKLTVEGGFKAQNLNKSQTGVLDLLKKEGRKNGFELRIQ